MAKSYFCWGKQNTCMKKRPYADDVAPILHSVDDFGVKPILWNRMVTVFYSHSTKVHMLFIAFLPADFNLLVDLMVLAGFYWRYEKIPSWNIKQCIVSSPFDLAKAVWYHEIPIQTCWIQSSNIIFSVTNRPVEFTYSTIWVNISEYFQTMSFEIPWVDWSF